MTLTQQNPHSRGPKMLLMGNWVVFVLYKVYLMA